MSTCTRQSAQAPMCFHGRPVHRHDPGQRPLRRRPAPLPQRQRDHRAPGPARNSTSIRKIPIHRRISLATRDRCAGANQSVVEGSQKTYFKGTQGRKVSQKAAETPTRQISRTPRHLHPPPPSGTCRYVERCFGITYKQAKRWVGHRCREQILDR